MRVVYINSVYKKGSTGNLVYGLHNFCLTHGIESYVLYGRGKRVRDPNVFKCSYEFLSKLNQLRARLTGVVYGGNLIATRKIIAKIKKYKPDIVHIHNLNDQFVNEYKLLRSLRKLNIRVLITLHSEQMYTGTCGYAIDCEQFMRGGCEKCQHIFLSTSSHIDRAKSSFKKLFKVYSYFDKNNLFFTSCTPWLKKRGSQSILIGRFKNEVVLNGGNSDVFKPIADKEKTKIKRKLGLPIDKKIILHVNPRPDDPIKGYQFISKLSESLPANYCICVAGKIPSNPVLKSNVMHLGQIDNQSILAELYGTADLTVMLSNRECFPMVIVESLLCGTPVAAFSCGGPDDCFPSNIVTFTKYGDVNLLAKSINRLVRFDRRKIAEYATKNLTINTMSERFIRLYKQL